MKILKLIAAVLIFVLGILAGFMACGSRVQAKYFLNGSEISAEEFIGYLRQGTLPEVKQLLHLARDTTLASGSSLPIVLLVIIGVIHLVLATFVLKGRIAGITVLSLICVLVDAWAIGFIFA